MKAGEVERGKQLLFSFSLLDGCPYFVSDHSALFLPGKGYLFSIQMFGQLINFLYGGALTISL